VTVSSDPERVGNVMPGLLNAISAYSPFQDATAPQLNDMRDVLKLGLQQFILGEITPEELAVNVDAANQSAWAQRSE
jgi:hypothetical protein